MKSPTISVIMPVYNGEKYLNEAIDSILNQTFTDFEFIIINDGSTDRTEEIILSYSDPRIIYVKNEKNLQIVKTLNKGIKVAKGKYIARMDADDISVLERFDKQIEFMQNNPNIDLCGTWLETFGNRNNIWEPALEHNRIKVNMLFNSAVMHATILAKSTFFSDLKYDENMVSAEDYHLWIQGMDKYHYAHIPVVLYKYRLHNSKTNKDELLKNANHCRKIMLEKCGCSLSDNEFDIFLKISLWKNVNIEELLPILNKIFYFNKKSNYFNKKLLLKSFIERVYSIERKRVNYSLKLFFTYHQFKTLRYLPFPLFSIRYVKFFIKCLMGYSYENQKE